MQSSNHLQTVIHFDVYCSHCEKKIYNTIMDLLYRQATWLVDLNGGACSRNSMAMVDTMKIQTNIQVDGACDRLRMGKCDTFAQLESQHLPNWNHKIYFFLCIYNIVLIKWLLCELAFILHFNRICMFF